MRFLLSLDLRICFELSLEIAAGFPFLLLMKGRKEGKKEKKKKDQGRNLTRVFLSRQKPTQYEWKLTM
jgi:hypothetical protein